jgi:predicted Zn-dependent protease
VALTAASEALQLAPTLEFLHANHAHALMFSGDLEAARAEYLNYAFDDHDARQKWEAYVRNDFASFRLAGSVNPLMDDIEQAFSR